MKLKLNVSTLNRFHAVSLLLLAGLAGCSSTEINAVRARGPIPSNSARIILTRIAKGSTQPLCVMDQGFDGASNPATAKGFWADGPVRTMERGGFNDCKLTAITEAEAAKLLPPGHPFVRRTMIEVDRYGVPLQDPTLMSALLCSFEGKEFAETRQVVQRNGKKCEAIAGEWAEVIGKVRAGDTVSWDRPPGTARLWLVTPADSYSGSYWHFAGPEFPVEAGKEYQVNWEVDFRARMSKVTVTKVVGGATP